MSSENTRMLPRPVKERSRRLNEWENNNVSGSLGAILIGPGREQVAGFRRLWGGRVDGEPGTRVTTWRTLIGWDSLGIDAGFGGEEGTANQSIGRPRGALRLARLARMVSVFKSLNRISLQTRCKFSVSRNAVQNSNFTGSASFSN